MKKIYLLLILLVSGFGFGQVNLTGSANYHAIVTATIGDATGDGCCCGGLGSLNLDGIGSASVLKKSDDSFWENTSNSFERDYTDSNLATSISLYSRRRTRSNGCRVTQEKDVTVLVGRNQDITYKDWDDANVTGVFAPYVYGTLRVQTYPVINLVNPNVLNNMIGSDSKINIPEITGVKEEYFNWMYHIEGEQERVRRGLSWRWVDKWRSLPAAYQAINKLNIQCKDFLPYEAIGKKITLRANVIGSRVELLYVKSAPHILSVETIKTSCFDTNDGKVKINFSRPLDVGETLSLDFDGMNGDDVYNITKDGIFDGKKLDNDNSFTVKKLNKGLTTLKLIGFFNQGVFKANTYVMDPQHQTSFTITSPEPVDFSLSSTNVNCYNGKDGTLTINVSGGTEEGYEYSLDSGVNWTPFKDPKSSKEILTGLFPVTKPSITYSIIVRDKNGCVAKVKDKVKVLTETISEPLAPLSLIYTYKQDPTFSGAFNGKITASISGGTIKDDKSYDYKWLKKTGEEFKVTAQYNSTNKSYTISLENAPAGAYKLTVTDKNYTDGINKAGCSIIESVNTLVEPKPIKIKLKVRRNISCNSANLGDEGNLNEKLRADGALVALVEGGKVLEPNKNIGLPYYFYWKKLNAKGEWDDLAINDSIAPDLSKGTYSVNVKDANGIMHGTYTPTEETPKAVEQAIAEPGAMKVVFSSGNVSCFQGKNGWAKASIKDGKSTYAYTWYGPDHNGIKTDELSNLVAGTYYIEVTDKVKGCFVKGSVVITEPTEEVKIEYKEIETPTFSGATNGRIVAKITGGTPLDAPLNNGNLYHYEWKNSKGTVQNATAQIVDGVYTITLKNVPADSYFLTIKDKNYNEATGQTVNCSVVESEVKLTEPDPLKVVFEIVRTISCNANNEFGDATDTTPKDGRRDESQDGILVAHVTGGTPLEPSVNNGLPYYYYWKKQQADGSWLALTDSKGETASNLSHGNYALNIEDKKGIRLGTYVNNILTQEIDVTQFMQEPPKLAVTITKGDVFCNGGNDGWAAANVTGGTPPYQYKWSNDVESDKNTVLKAGEYWVFVTDAKGCTTQESVTILEPKAPLAVKFTEVLNPTFYKATNGKIVTEVTGGTIANNNSYGYEWKNSKGIVQTTTTASFNNGVYTITLYGLPEELYSLTVRDANYDAATNKKGCTVVNALTALDDPEPLEVSFEVIRTISCNVSNEFGNETNNNPLDNQRDESQDGILKVHAKGGIQLKADKNNGLPYFYTWKKKQKDGSWVLWNDQDETAENLSEGTYALNIEDANGIKLGTYSNTALISEEDAKQYVPQPTQLKLELTKLNASCNNGSDGWAEAYVTGGTPPYTYAWTNGETTSKIENITTNNYFVIVTDAKGCIVQGSIFVGDPKGILTTETVKDPICYKGNDGSIVLNVTGGNLPYSYIWNTGATTKDLGNLTAGNYEVTINCLDCCVYKKRFVLKDPQPVVVNIGPDRTLCIDQNLDLEATIADQKAQYHWTSTNGFSSNEAKINVSKAGTYKVKVTSGLGCIGEDEVVIKTSQTPIGAEFLLSSQAYLDEEVILVNTSNPFGDSTKWVIPSGVKVVEQKEKYITLKFDAAGFYTIGLQQTQGECFATFNKNIAVEKRSTLPNGVTASQFIVDFIVTPNPTNGNFKAIVSLENTGAINLRLFSTSGQNTIIQKKESGKKKYEIDFETSLESGMYVLVLETGQQTLVKKIIIY
ncbi:T9SS type A sorting domain-containing protein [Flavobacterium sp. N502540]|uniref:T9SS type A sorting domain-containing protein n=1 Tax=Flavobacterium sp. N502540 TaxID=2986838 RepID=UPI0022257FE1|nr:T9SS type A sorting domain-containing protein [Flavobacterium sp. N502540]